jgi:hypothetical protein
MPAMLPACDALPALVTALPCCCCSACPQPSAPAPNPTTSLLPLALPLARLSSVLSATDGELEEGEVPLTPPLLKCLVGTRHQKYRLYRLCPPGRPGLGHPPGEPTPQKFSNQKSGRVAGGV